LGAILALTSVYAGLLGWFLRARHEDAARRAMVSVFLAFLPAVVVGFWRMTSSRTCCLRRPS
jgi:undecaprenyl-diphosphatase